MATELESYGIYDFEERPFNLIQPFFPLYNSTKGLQSIMMPSTELEQFETWGVH